MQMYKSIPTGVFLSTLPRKSPPPEVNLLREEVPPEVKIVPPEVKKIPPEVRSKNIHT